LLFDIVHRVSNGDANVYQDSQTHLHADVDPLADTGALPDTYRHRHTNSHTHTRGDGHANTYYRPSHRHQASRHASAHPAPCYTNAQGTTSHTQAGL